MDERRIAKRLQQYNEIVSRLDDSVALMVATEMGIFAGLLEGSRTLKSLAEQFGVEQLRLRQVLDIVVHLGFLDKTGDLYALVAGDEQMFDPSDPWSTGLGYVDIERFIGTRAQALNIVRGAEQSQNPGVGGEATADERFRFLRYLHQLSKVGAEEVAILLATSDVKRIVDIGCGLGTYTAALLHQLPEATAVLVDRENGRPAVEQFLESEGLADRTEFIGGDFLVDDFGSDFDLALISNVLHCLSPTNAEALLKRAAERLTATGRIAVKEVAVNDERVGPPSALRFGFQMGLLGSGDVYPRQEVLQWFEALGLKHSVPLRLSAVGESYLILGGRTPFKSLLAPRLKAAASKRSTRVVILGGGIGGLATGLSLSRVGYEVEIYEKRLPDASSGLGFITLKNGLEALDQLGLGDAALRMGSRINGVVIRDEAGVIHREEEMSHAMCMRRRDIIELLRSALPANCLKFGKDFHELVYDESGRATTATFTDRTEAAGDLFVGADGVRSRVRQHLFSFLDVNPVRVKELVHLTDAPHLAASLKNRFIKTVHSDGGLAVGVLPCGFGQVVWFVQYDSHRYEMEGRSPAVRRHFAQELIGDWPDPIAEVLSRTDFSTGHIWRTTDFCPPRVFHKNNVVLVGDAVHTMMTFTSQGVGAAMQDGLTLARCLMEQGDSNDYESAFRNYANERYPVLLHFLLEGRSLAEQFLIGEAAQGGVPLVHLPEELR